MRPYSRRTPKPVTDTRLRFSVAAQCRFCATIGSVGLETTVHGRSVLLTWCCRKWGRDWAVHPPENSQQPAGPVQPTDADGLAPSAARHESLAIPQWLP